MIDTSSIIHGIKPARLSADERSATLIRRPWSHAERRVVLNGFFGRLSLGVEPILCGLGFTLITLGIFLSPRLFPQWVNPDMIIIAPIFGLGVVASAVYAIAVMVAPARALFHTLRPIYVVDGYIRYRGRDGRSEPNQNGYVAVLCDDRRVACEWPTIGQIELPDVTRPALCEFSEYGGVHAIDGRDTGVLPRRIAFLGVGIHRDRARRERRDPDQRC